MSMIFFLHNLTEARFAHFFSLPKLASHTFKNLQDADYGAYILSGLIRGVTCRNNITQITTLL